MLKSPICLIRLVDSTIPILGSDLDFGSFLGKIKEDFDENTFWIEAISPSISSSQVSSSLASEIQIFWILEY